VTDVHSFGWLLSFVSYLSADELVFLYSNLSCITVRILVLSLTSIDLVKDALIDTILLSHLSQFFAWTFEHSSLLFLNMHYIVPKPTTANEKISYIHKFYAPKLNKILTMQNNPMCIYGINIKPDSSNTVHFESLLYHLGETQADIDGQCGEQHEAQDGRTVLVVIKSFGAARTKA
jgi:hypothetical protein